ncbi:uncharacterized protein Z518_04922 [Rhinocladiella mackenziei CBS 650.93]|uniref:Rhinocladiella mackenziei CBS 650.93 unplaced genomic scaffold supercont1.3, whole genome shotgun sequence n=1 Tax=Rhinocladiella mackenziei CBS 650.93 TaxID=1442369 RepID=A0A0D2IUW3_9EURO|nr:uncharacterized protein Z518_04922 [Rhinocladiella mackenziei CBS 650.93]KIX06946.1 hypothetical protein Z518_04922 [Rhinocladiella mackenziei CBS 650.93]
MHCTYTAPSRKSKPKKRQSNAKIEESTSDTQARLRYLETLLEQVTERLEAAERRNEVQDKAQLRGPKPTATVTLSTMPTSEDGNADDDDDSPKSISLPPLQQVLPVVQIFLQKFNAVLPLFHADTLLHLVHDFYHRGPQKRRDPVAWGAINIVLALAHRQGLAGSSNTKYYAECFSRAQSVLSAVTLGNIELLNIQVLVGMVMLSQSSQDLQPSLILLAMTMRLAHKLGLHNRASSAHLDPVLARQRTRVFWLAYILDKDLSMRSKQPSIQLDDDIDLDLPSPKFAATERQVGGDDDDDDADGVGAGIITTADGAAKMNYFVARIQLAVVEGGVYDYLYSTRSQKRSPKERSRALESVASALERWKASNPPEFSAAAALRGVSPDTLRFLCVLHSTSLLCTTAISQAHAWNAQWVASLRRHGREGTVPLLPPHWEVIVDEARDLMVLLSALRLTDRWNFWKMGCTYMTAMILLTANSMHRPRHEKISFDSQLVASGLQTIDTMVEEMESEALRSFRGTCAELNQEVQRRSRGEATMKANHRDFFLYFSDAQSGI